MVALDNSSRQSFVLKIFWQRVKWIKVLIFEKNAQNPDEPISWTASDLKYQPASLMYVSFANFIQLVLVTVSSIFASASLLQIIEL